MGKPPQRPRLVLEAGFRSGKLVVLESRDAINGAGMYWCRCDCGQEVAVSASHLKQGQRTTCTQCFRGRGDAPTYRAAHARIDRAKGKAGDHRCVDCGAPANEWSYDGDDPNELLAEPRGTSGVRSRYSLNPERYVSRCRACHKGRDGQPRPAIDLTGQRFGGWLVVERDWSRPPGQAYWFCRCDCGVTRSVVGGSLRRGITKGCMKCRSPH